MQSLRADLIRRGAFAGASRRALAAVTGLWCAAAPAQGTSQPATAPVLADAPSLLPLVLAFVLVLALVPVAIWVLKRMSGGLPSSAAGLRVVGQLPLGTQQRIVIVEAGSRWLLLGVSGASINRIGTLPKGEVPAGANAPVSFGALLSRFGGRDGEAPRG